jgi:hypothetical protein
MVASNSSLSDGILIMDIVDIQLEQLATDLGMDQGYYFLVGW